MLSLAPYSAGELSHVAAGLIGAAAVAIYPALLEYQGMLMSEPLAATLLSGAVWRCSGQADREAAGAGCCRACCWAPRRWCVRSTWGSPSCWRWSSSPAAPVPTGAAAWRRRRSCWPGSRSSSPPGRSATPSPRPRGADLDRRRPGPLRRHLPAFRRRPGEGRRRGRRPPPGLFGPDALSGCGSSRSSPASPPSRYPDLETDQALCAHGP